MGWRNYTAAGAEKTTSQALGYATTLPAGPVDGQETILVDSLSNPTYQWRFRYNASEATYKWEFVGGTPKIVEVVTGESQTGTSYVDLTTVGPSFTAPVAGDYTIGWGATAESATADIYPIVGLKVGSGAIADTTDALGFRTASGDDQEVLAKFIRRDAVAASDVIKLQYKTIASGTGIFQRRWLYVQPIRVI